ncbi:MAG: 3-isopropylmalate dehydratase small subunit [Trueperaceae bacterium]|nr:3-isopropylmalate dehydratase small subunit [Trueperaceae bacterium]
MTELENISEIRGTAVVVPGDDIDTDRIIPARFLKCVTFDALGPQLFHDERYEEDGTPKDHPLNAPGAEHAKVLVSGDNFGCGSSREHAPQSIHKAGFRAVIASSFAEIFFGNALTLGMPCVTLSPDDLGTLQALLRRAPDTEVTVDVAGREVRAGDQLFPAHLPDGARSALLEGRWDPLSELLTARDDAAALAARLGYGGTEAA